MIGAAFERIENQSQIRRLDHRSAVLDRKRHFRLQSGQHRSHRCVGIAVPQGVRNEVAEHLIEAVRIEGTAHIATDLQLNSPAGVRHTQLLQFDSELFR